MITNRKHLVDLEEFFDYLAEKNYDKDYIRNCLLEIFVFKYVHDYNTAKKRVYEKQFEKSKQAKEWVERKMLRERFILPSQIDYNSLLNHTGKNDLAKETNNKIIALESNNRDKLNGLFSIDFQMPKTTIGPGNNWQQTLRKIVTGFRNIQFVPANGNENPAYEVLEKILFHWPITNSYKGAEYYLAPAALNELLVKLTSPQPGDRIFDPCCNLGALLAAAGSSVMNKNNQPLSNFSLHGQTSFPDWARISKIFMLILEFDGAQITIGDPINNPALDNGKLFTYDVLISNLPWNIQDWTFSKARPDIYNRFTLGTPPEGKGDLAYIQHMIACSSDEGRIAVIIPNGVLFREGRELYIRENMVKNNLLEAIIALPSNLFFSTKQSCAIMVLRKNKGQNKNVLFIDASQNYQADKRQNKLQKNDIAQIVDTYKSFQNNNAVSTTNYSSIVSPEQIEENGFCFTVSRYVENTPAGKNDIDSAVLVTEIQALEKELFEIRNEIDRNLEKLALN